MPQPVLASNSGNIAINVILQADDRYVCEVTPSLGGQTSPTERFHGQNPKHAIAIGLENLAHAFRQAAEAEQNVEWEAVDRSPSGKSIDKRFHVILHYERIAEEESKFEAMVNTQMGNTVVENAEISIIQVDPDLTIEPMEKLYNNIELRGRRGWVD